MENEKSYISKYLGDWRIVKYVIHDIIWTILDVIKQTNNEDFINALNQCLWIYHAIIT